MAKLAAIDECSINVDDCDVNADCADTVGSFTCTCIDGFAGDGVNCTGAVIKLAAQITVKLSTEYWVLRYLSQLCLVQRLQFNGKVNSLK